jgi:hypothetical protein
MMKMEKQTSSQVWLRLPGYRVAALKPEFGDAATELERAIHEGIPAHPDSARTDFYDVAVHGGWAYIHVHRNRQVVYLVAQFASTLNSFLANGAGSIHDEFCAAIR